MLAGSGAAVMIVGLCLMIFSNGVKFLKPFTLTGRQALTLYIAHIFIGMGILEALGMFEGQSAQMAIFAASIFIIASIFYVMLYSRFFKVGLLEWLMRKVTG
jgi:uncharacterized membrane protein YeiB